MPIGKDSITKRVAKQTESAPETMGTAKKATAKVEEKNIAPELVATVAAPKASTKKATTSAAAKKTSTTSKKTTAAKKETLTPPVEESRKVDTTVISNIAPETVAAVIGHKENSKLENVQIGDKMPVHLL